MYIADKMPDETTCDSNQASDVNATQGKRFIETMAFDPVYDENSKEDILQHAEPIDRSCKQFDANFAFRYSLLLCLLNAPPFLSDKADLIKLFETKDLVLPQTADPFKRTYSPSKAIYFYTKEDFIYAQLNNALRTTNVSHLVLFRFFIQDIFDQLRELMAQQTDDQILTVYRGQQSSTFEVADLFTAYHRNSPIVITSFFSTSKERDCAVGFLRNKDLTLFDMDRKPILFKITVRKQDASRHFPFADISKISNVSEEAEVLFVPGQMFTINNFNIIHEHDLNIFFFEMSLDSEFGENFTVVYDRIKNIWDTHMNDPFLNLAQLLTTYKRFNEAKELYTRLLLENIDTKKKFACYQGLFSIAMDQNDTNEGMMMFQKMTETKVGSENLSINSDRENLSTNFNIAVSQTDYEKINTSVDQLMNINSQLSLDQPLDETFAYLQSDEYRDAFAQLPDQLYTLAMTLMKNGVYDLAIQYFETVLGMIRILWSVSFDPLLKAQYYMQLGHCYRELNLNDKALENYKLSLEQNIHLPLNEYIDTLIGIGKALEATNNYREALTRYTEVAKIYENNSTVGGLKERCDMKEACERIISHLALMDKTCETS
jgi:tetratricopeptide (TPR) repeat protein